MLHRRNKVHQNCPFWGFFYIFSQCKMYPGVFVYHALKIPSPTLSRVPLTAFISFFFFFLTTDKSVAPNRVKREQNNDCVLKMSSVFGALTWGKHMNMFKVQSTRPISLQRPENYQFMGTIFTHSSTKGQALILCLVPFGSIYPVQRLCCCFLPKKHAYICLHMYPVVVFLRG